MPSNDTSTSGLDCEAIVIGAGVAGLCALYRLREMGLSVRAFDSAADVGGVWYWNRYPGARFDSESYTYCYSFSDALLQEWDWQENFAAQPEILSYLNHVADRFDLRKDITFNTRIVSATFDAEDAAWRVKTEDGRQLKSRYLIAAVGVLSAYQAPDIEGIRRFGGKTFHTARWPREGVDLAGKRVGVIGTGATGVQVIQTIAAEVAHLTVFQRTANYCIPQRNSPLDDDRRREIKRDYPAILKRCRETFGGFIHDFDPRSGLEVSAEEREATFEALWQQPGFAFWLGNFSDLLMDATVNGFACDFLKRKIAERVRNPDVARKLMPDHPFGTKRVPLENGYYEAYNRDNVQLVDLRETPIVRMTRSGLETTAGHHALDIVIFATGFDAVTGALTRLHIEGEGGMTLKEKWRQGPKTYLGLQVAAFPNLFTVTGAHNAGSLCNAVRCTEQNVDWVVDCIAHMRQRKFRRIAATAEAESGWTEHVGELSRATLLHTMTDSWFFGANTPGKPRSIAIYPGGAALYRERCDEVAKSGYPGFDFA